MTNKPCTLSELRHKFLRGDLTAQQLASLRHDPRAGARTLYESLQQKLRAHDNEKARLETLLQHERRLWSCGHRFICGVDEVGVGPLLGPVVAAAVVLPQGLSIEGVNDSKKLSAKKRQALAATIREHALGVGIGQCSAVEIDAMNIYRAATEAMRRSIVALDCAIDHVLVDAHRIDNIRVPQTALVMGDATCHAIAAASIVAKVYRDALMTKLHEELPGYGVANHKGYGTKEHLQALRRLGPTRQHRRSFAPVRAAAMLHGVI